MTEKTGKPKHDRDGTLAPEFPFVSEIEYAGKLAAAIGRMRRRTVGRLLAGGIVPPVPEALYAYRLRNVFRDAELFRLLVTHGLDLSRTFGGYPALHLCLPDYLERAEWSLPPEAMALVFARADVDARDREGRTPLFRASCLLGGDDPADVPLELIRRGADVNAADAAGDTPLHVCRNVTLMKALLERGADTEARNRRGETPILTPCSRDPRLLGSLIDRGARFDVTDRYGRGPCHFWAYCNMRWCSEGAVRCLELLLKNGCSINVVDRSGETPLHHLVREMARLVGSSGFHPGYFDRDSIVANGLRLYGAACRRGADPARRSRKGETPTELWERLAGTPWPEPNSRRKA